MVKILEDPACAPMQWQWFMSAIFPGITSEHTQWCQEMIRSGVEYLRKHEHCQPTFRQYYTVSGMLQLTNNDARDLWFHMRDLVTHGMKDKRWTLNTRAAALRSALFIHVHGWEKYMQEKCQHPALDDGQCLFCKVKVHAVIVDGEEKLIQEAA